MCPICGVRFALPDEEVTAKDLPKIIVKGHVPVGETCFVYNLLQCLATLWFLVMSIYYSLVCYNHWLILFFPMIFGVLVVASSLLALLFTVWRVGEIWFNLIAHLSNHCVTRKLSYARMTSLRDGGKLWNKATEDSYVKALTREFSQKFHPSNF